MYKITVLLMFFLFTLSKINAQAIYSIDVKNIDGDTLNLTNYTGKKIMFMVLPVTADSNYLQFINFVETNDSTVQVIGVLSLEDGFQLSMTDSVKNLYASHNIVLTEGMNIRKSSGGSQSALMQWLTDKNKNHHFDNDALGIGHKFFVNETGRLYAVISPRTPIQSFIVNKIVQAPSSMQE